VDRLETFKVEGHPILQKGRFRSGWINETFVERIRRHRADDQKGRTPTRVEKIMMQLLRLNGGTHDSALAQKRCVPPPRFERNRTEIWRASFLSAVRRAAGLASGAGCKITG
jgi:hypothetical protein